MAHRNMEHLANKLPGEDIVWSAVKAAAARNGAGWSLRLWLNITDVLTLIRLLDHDAARAVSIFDPRLMFVSRDGPEMSPALAFSKDYGLGISVLTEGPEDVQVG